MNGGVTQYFPLKPWRCVVNDVDDVLKTKKDRTNFAPLNMLA
jgi:hypothetical protein